MPEALGYCWGYEGSVDEKKTDKETEEKKCSKGCEFYKLTNKGGE